MKKSDLEAAFDTQFTRLGQDLRKPKPNFKFAHPKRGWAVDRAWPRERVAVELEGGGHGRRVKCHNCGKTVRARKGDGSVGKEIRIGGWHTRGGRFQKDAEKYNVLEELGWVVLRYTNHDVMAEPFEMVDQIRRVLCARGHQFKMVDPLSADEIKVLYMIAGGFTTPQIADRLGERKHTISSRAQNLCQKLVCDNRTSAVARAIFWGLIDINKIPWRSDPDLCFHELLD
jgi:very-short-patch-repair endonuclease